MARPKSDIRERLLTAARKRFLAQGVDGASLREIAREAKTTIGMVYYYFRTKDELFFACVEQVYDALLVSLTQALSGEDAYEQRVGRLYERLARMTEDELTVARLVFREILVASERRGRIAEMAARGHVQIILQALGRAVQNDELKAHLPPMVMVIATFALGLLPQILRRLLGDALPSGMTLPSPDAMARAFTEVVMHGLARHDASSS
jgi:AcrR family transcriptional regulator